MSNPSRHRTCIENRSDDNEEILIDVFYRAIPGREGARDGRRGLKIEPDEPAHIEIDYVHDRAGSTICLTVRETERIIEEIIDWLSDRGHTDREDRG